MPPKNTITLYDKVRCANKLGTSIKEQLNAQDPPIAETERMLRLVESVVDEVLDTIKLNHLEKGDSWISPKEANEIVDSRMRILMELEEGIEEVVAAKKEGVRASEGTGREGVLE